MKILRVISSGFEEGGAEIGVAHIQPILERRGHVVKILASDTRPDLPHFNHFTFRAPYGVFAKFMYTFNFSAYRALKKALCEFKPDIVHLHTLGLASPAVLFALRGYPTVATVHGPEGYTRDLLIWCMPKADFKHGEYDLHDARFIGKLRYLYYRYVNYPLYRIGFRNIDRFVTISTYIGRLMKGQGVESTYVPNGIRLLPYVSHSQKKADHAIIFAGRLEKFKGLEYALRALPEIVRRFPDTILTIAGSGKDKAELEALAQSLGITQHVRFLGYVPHSAMPEIYGNSTIAVVPSIWPEVCSRSGIEAMSAGLPIVGSNVGGSPDWLHDGETGYLVPPKDPAALADAINKLFADPERLLTMGRNARAKAEEYDIELHATRIEKIYEEVIEKARTTT